MTAKIYELRETIGVHEPVRPEVYATVINEPSNLYDNTPGAGRSIASVVYINEWGYQFVTSLSTFMELYREKCVDR